MVADVGIQEINGVPTGTFTDMTSSRFCTNDLVTPGLTYPIPIPTSGFNWSFWKSHVLVMSGTFTQINNIRWYTGGSTSWTFGTSGNLYIGKTFSGDIGAPTYVQASGTVGTTGIRMTSGHLLYNISGHSMIVATTYTTASPATIDSTAYTSGGDRSKAVVTQVAVGSDATQGNQSGETVTFRYDEI